jgi:exodeoxyribonuclease-3
VYTGDLNVAHQDIDLKNPSANRQSAGFSFQERQKFTELLAAGFVDTFRLKYPMRTGAYTWWSYLRHARDTNAGWRIDYFIVSQRLAPKVSDALIYSDIYGSDHCPVGLILNV